MTSPKVDYRIRPAKHAERLMIAETLSRLKHFAPLDSYRYFGMGSLYFRDHLLFHKRLGILDLTNIEKADSDPKKLRFTFNRPYAAVELLFGTPSDVPKRFDSRPVVAWYDYEDHLEERALEDIEAFCRTVPDCSVLIVTVNAEPPNGLLEDKVSLIRKELGARAPDDLGPRYFKKERLADLYGLKFIDEIERSLASRAPNSDPETQLRYRPLFHFRYRDGQPLMMTIGGLFVRQKHLPRVDLADFESLPYVRQNGAPYRIEVPKLTLRETQYLDSLLPTDDEEEMSKLANEKAGIPELQAKMYAKIYRYLPSYADVDI